MSIRLIIVAVIALVGVTSCGSGASTASEASAPAAGASSNVVVKNFAFTPGSLRVRTGTTVIWMNADSTVHTTTVDKAGAESWDSGNLSQNQFYAVIFTTPGSYSYHCSVHNYMTGLITVTG
jgi:plastocyanin